MPLSIEDVQPLLVLQQIDLEIRQKQKQLDALPQRAQIAEARRKRAQIQEKGEQVSALRANVERELEHQRFEDAQLAEKQEQTQEKITSESGDYRAVEALTQELEGFAQRRTALAEKIGGLKTRKAQVDQVAAQVDAALAAINAQEQKAVESFQQEGGALTEAIARAQAVREDRAAPRGRRHCAPGRPAVHGMPQYDRGQPDAPDSPRGAAVHVPALRTPACGRVRRRFHEGCGSGRPGTSGGFGHACSRRGVLFPCGAGGRSGTRSPEDGLSARPRQNHPHEVLPPPFA